MKKKQRKKRQQPERKKRKLKRQPQKKREKIILWEWLFLIIFVIAVAIGYWWTQKHYYSESEITKAVITKTTVRYNGHYQHILEVEYQYTFEGKTYTATENTYNFDHHVGDTIEIEVSKEYNDVSQLLND